MRTHTFFFHLSPIIAVLQFLVRSIFSTDDSQSCISNRVLSRVWTISKCIINIYTLLFNTHLKLNLSQTELLILSKTFSSHCLSLPSNWHAMVAVAQATNPRGIFAFTLTLPSLTLPSIYSHNLTPSHHPLNTRWSIISSLNCCSGLAVGFPTSVLGPYSVLSTEWSI